VLAQTKAKFAGPFCFPRQRQVPRLLAKEYWQGPLEVLVGLAFWNSSAPQLSNPTIEITVRTATEQS
jgi:hypothetical protein